MFNAIVLGFGLGLAFAAACDGRLMTAGLMLIVAFTQIPAIWLAQKINAESA